MDQQELTVESALEELRQMFPRWFISIRRQEFMDNNMRESSRRVEIYVGTGMSPPSCEAETLSEAMSQVRSWHESQSVKE